MKRSETLNYKLGYKDGYKAALNTFGNTFNPASFYAGAIVMLTVMSILLAIFL